MNKKIFKYVFMLMVALMGTVAFTSCGSDDDDGESTPTTDYSKAILGTWKVTSTGHIFDTSDSFTFNSDGSVTWNNGEKLKTNNTYTLSGNTLQVDFNIKDSKIDATALGTVTITGNNMVYVAKWNENSGGGWTEAETVTLTKQ